MRCVNTNSSGALTTSGRSLLCALGHCHHHKVPLCDGLNSDPRVSVGEAGGPGFRWVKVGRPFPPSEGNALPLICWCNQTFNYSSFSKAIDAKKIKMNTLILANCTNRYYSESPNSLLYIVTEH